MESKIKERSKAIIPKIFCIFRAPLIVCGLYINLYNITLLLRPPGRVQYSPQFQQALSEIGKVQSRLIPNHHKRIQCFYVNDLKIIFTLFSLIITYIFKLTIL